jgi:hypothetical protein
MTSSRSWRNSFNDCEKKRKTTEQLLISANPQILDKTTVTILDALTPRIAKLLASHLSSRA